MEIQERTTRGTFKKGMIPWNKGVTGIHFSLATEFKRRFRKVYAKDY